jgi:hypothetical protein
MLAKPIASFVTRPAGKLFVRVSGEIRCSSKANSLLIVAGNFLASESTPVSRRKRFGQ